MWAASRAICSGSVPSAPSGSGPAGAAVGRPPVPSSGRGDPPPPPHARAPGSRERSRGFSGGRRELEGSRGFDGPARPPHLLTAAPASLGGGCELSCCCLWSSSDTWARASHLASVVGLQVRGGGGARMLGPLCVSSSPCWTPAPARRAVWARLGSKSNFPGFLKFLPLPGCSGSFCFCLK